MLERPPALGHQGEAALAQAAQRVAGPVIKIELPAACWLFHRDMNADPRSFVPGISQYGQADQAGAQDGEGVLTGGSDVMDPAGQDRRHPQRDAAGGEQGLDVPAEPVGLGGIPAVDLPALPADGLFLQPVGGDHLAVQDQVRQPLLSFACSSAWRRSAARAASTVMASSRYR